jgi:hypothetical protein
LALRQLHHRASSTDQVSVPKGKRIERDFLNQTGISARLPWPIKGEFSASVQDQSAWPGPVQVSGSDWAKMNLSSALFAHSRGLSALCSIIQIKIP